MKKILAVVLLLTCFVSCASSTKDVGKNAIDVEEILDQAENNATSGGRRVLETSRGMIANQDVIIGGCWHYMNGVYDRSGFTSKKRTSIFSSKIKGPYAESDLIKAGDWLYFVNHSYNDIEHSAIFVAWIDEDAKEALMVNYIGGNKKKPGTYKRFIIDQVYNIYRPQD